MQPVENLLKCRLGVHTDPAQLQVPVNCSAQQIHRIDDQYNLISSESGTVATQIVEIK